MKKSLIALISGVAVLVVAGTLCGYSYVSAKRDYQKGIDSLDKKQWSAAESYFLQAKKKGILFFQDGVIKYNESLSEYEQKQFNEAQTVF